MSSEYKEAVASAILAFSPQLQPCVLSPDDHRPSLQQQAFKASRGTRFPWHELLAPSSLVVGIANITGRPPPQHYGTQQPGQQLNAMSFLTHGPQRTGTKTLAHGPSRTGPKTRLRSSYHGRPLCRPLRSGHSSRCSLHPSFVAAHYLCCTRPPDCHVCRSSYRITRDRRTLFQRRALVATRSGPSTAILDPRSSADRTQDALIHGPPRTGPKTHLCVSSHGCSSRTSRLGGPSPELSRLEDLRPDVFDCSRC